MSIPSLLKSALSAIIFHEKSNKTNVIIYPTLDKSKQNLQMSGAAFSRSKTRLLATVPSVRMKYDEYIAKGWYIGSGVIEAGCKTVVCQRFKQPGMFWSPKSTKALLKSNRLCEYSNFLVKGLPQVDIQSKPA